MGIRTLEAIVWLLAVIAIVVATPLFENWLTKRLLRDDRTATGDSSRTDRRDPL